MPSAAEQVRAAIADAGGAIPFERFMDLALYGEGGFYTTSGSAGRRGDFITSPEVGPLFGVVLARALDTWWRALGEPADFTVIEAGAGPGTLARSVLAARPECSPRYIAVDVSAAQRAGHPPTMLSVGSLAAARAAVASPVTGVVIANELLDNLPFRLAVFDGSWRESFVSVGADDGLVEVLADPIDPLPSWLPDSAPLGARAPVQQRAAAWVESAASALHAGRVVVLDYAVATTGELARRGWRDWLRTYRGHERGLHYLASVGTQDITADVCVDQLPAPDAVRSQAQFLHLHGIDELVEEGRHAWRAAAANPTLQAMTMRSRIREADALLDPAGLGGFFALEWTVT